MKRLPYTVLLAWSLLLFLPPPLFSPDSQRSTSARPPSPTESAFRLQWRRGATCRSPEIQVDEKATRKDVLKFYEESYPVRLKS